MDDPRDARLQWAKGRDISWDGVLDGTSAANRFLLVTALTRKADLASTLRRHKDAVGEENAPAYASLPETFVIDPEESDEDEEDEDGGCVGERAKIDQDSAKTVPHAVRRRGGAWALKASESNGGDDIVFFDAGDAADVARAERFMNAHAERSCAATAPWVVQRYVESATVDGEERRGDEPKKSAADRTRIPKRAFKFHLRAHALVAGDCHIYVHDDVVGLVASAPVRERDDLCDLRAHATNHRVRARGEAIANANANEHGTPPATHLSLEDVCRAVSSSVGGRPGSGLRTNLELCPDRLRERIRAIAADVFAAARSKAGGAAGFVPIEGGSFELFGLDFLVDAEMGAPRLLEVNSDPSMAVFGVSAEGKRRCAALLRDVLSIALPRMETDGRPESACGAHTEGDDEGEGDEAGAVPSAVEKNARKKNAFRKVWSARSRFEDPAEGRRRVKRLVSLTASLAARVVSGGVVGEAATRRASVAVGSPGAAGAAAALRRAGGWHVESDPRAPLCSFQWAPHRLIRWDRVMDWRETENAEKGKKNAETFVVANHHYARLGLFRPEALAEAVDAFERRAARESSPPTSTAETLRLTNDDNDDAEARARRFGGRRSTVRAFALVAGSRTSMRVAVRRRVEGLEAFLLETRLETKRAFAVVAAASRRAFEAAASFKGERLAFLPFANCFETYALTLVVETSADGDALRARVVRVEDAFPSDDTKKTLEEKEDADALADAAVEAALSCFFGEDASASASDRPAEDAFEFA